MSRGRTSGERRKSAVRGVAEVVVLFAVSFALVFGFVRPVVASPVYVDSGSMIPTLRIHDHLLVNKLADDFSTLERGDVVLFDDPAGGETPLIKRVVGLPGETVELRDGDLYINGSFVEEPYKNDRAPDEDFGPETVPENHMFVMGDNRGNSLDSRFFGAIPDDDVIGAALFRFWPPGRAGLL